MKAFLFRVLRAPLDVILVTADLIVLGQWKLAVWLSSMFGVLGPVSGPFCHRRQRVQSREGQPLTVCGHALRYGNLTLFKLVCPWAVCDRVSGGLSVPQCQRQHRFRFGSLRLAVLCLAFVTLWVGIARAVITGLIH